MSKPIETGYDHMNSPETVRASKTQRLIEYLKEKKKITPKEAWMKFGIYRLGAVIFRLRRNKQWDINTEMVKTPLGEEHAVYIVNHIPKEK